MSQRQIGVVEIREYKGDFSDLSDTYINSSNKEHMIIQNRSNIVVDVHQWENNLKCQIFI